MSRYELAHHLLVGGPMSGQVIEMGRSLRVPVPAPHWPGRVPAYAGPVVRSGEVPVVDYFSVRFGSGLNRYRIATPMHDPSGGSLLVPMLLLGLAPSDLERVRSV